jgi:hypothetical protein
VVVVVPLPERRDPPRPRPLLLRRHTLATH